MNSISLNDFVTPTKPRSPVLVSTRVVAKAFDRTHKDILKALKNIKCSESFRSKHFVRTTYVDQLGRKQPETLLTRSGFVFVATSLQGSKAMAFKELFLDAFERLTAIVLEQEREMLNAYQKNDMALRQALLCRQDYQKETQNMTIKDAIELLT